MAMEMEMKMSMATEHMVKTATVDATFKKGQDIMSSNKLKNVVFEGEFLEKASAICSGSNPGDSYTLDFYINPLTPSSFQSQCSCPATMQIKGRICKHLVALFLLRIRDLRQMKSSAGSPHHLPVSTDEHLSNMDKNEKATNHKESPKVLSWDDMMKECETSVSLQDPCAQVKKVVEVRRRALPPWMLGIVAGSKEKGLLDNPGRNLNRQQKDASFIGRTKRSSKNANGLGIEECDIASKDPETPESLCRKGNQSKSEINEENEAEMEDILATRRDTKGRIDVTNSQHTKFPAMQECNHDALSKKRQNRQAYKKAGQNMTTMNKKNVVDQEYDSEISENEPNENVSSSVKPQNHNRLQRLRKTTGNKLKMEAGDNNRSVSREVEPGSKLDITMAELISIAKKNLAEEKSSDQAGDDQLGNTLDSTEANVKGENSIFSSTKWKEVVPGRRSQYDASVSSQIPTKVMDTSTNVDKKCRFDGSVASHADFLPSVNMDVDTGCTLSQGAKQESTESIAEDMFGLFFGTSANAEKKISTAIKYPDTEVKYGKNIDEVKELPTVETSENMPMPMTIDQSYKKKSSLKDKVKMLLD